MSALCACVVAFVLLQAAAAQQQPEDKILLRDVKQLDFHRNDYTHSNHNTPAQELVCIPVEPVGCPVEAEFNLAVCFNTGLDSTDTVVWECQAQMPSSYKFEVVSASVVAYNENSALAFSMC
jgi:hypothetical protein